MSLLILGKSGVFCKLSFAKLFSQKLWSMQENQHLEGLAHSVYMCQLRVGRTYLKAFDYWGCVVRCETDFVPFLLSFDQNNTKQRKRRTAKF